MGKRNPYRVVEKIGNIALAVFCIVVVLAVATGVAVQLGWWALLIPPGMIAGGFLLMLVGAGLEALGEKWTRAKWRWDERKR